MSDPRTPTEVAGDRETLAPFMAQFFTNAAGFQAAEDFLDRCEEHFEWSRSQSRQFLRALCARRHVQRCALNSTMLKLAPSAFQQLIARQQAAANAWLRGPYRYVLEGSPC